MDDFMTVMEVATKLKKAPKTIYHYIETKKFPPSFVIRFGKSIRIGMSDLEKWIESQRGE